MIFNRNKIYALGLFIISLLAIVFLVIVFWNLLPKENMGKIAWMIILFSIAVVTLCALYILYLRESNNDILNKIIDKKVEEERSKILSEFSRKDEIIEDVKIDIDEIINKIIPKGNFKNMDSFAAKFLQNLAPEIEMSQGILYMLDKEKGVYNFISGYALTATDKIADFKPGENLNGQAALSKEIMVIHDIPDEYLMIESGLGKSKPFHLIIVPILSGDECITIIEIATFKSNTDYILDIMKRITIQLSEKIQLMQKS